MKEPTKFNRGNNRGTKVCPLCGKRTWKSRGFDMFCEDCTNEMEQENAHVDGSHITHPNPEGCPLCRAEAEEQK